MNVRVLSVPTPSHGRVLIKDADSATALVGFHGYAESAEDMMDALQRVPGSDALTLISIQALNRFYTRGDHKIVASWMTRQDREQAIADNIEYADRALDGISRRFVAVGFSQGAAMAYRAGVLGRHSFDGVIAIGGDVPPDVKDVPPARWPRVLISAGTKDHWYTPAKVAADQAFLERHVVAHKIQRHDEGHEITADVLDAIARFIR